MLTTFMTTKNENGSSPVDGILKVDALGRVRVPKEKREQLLDDFEASGMSGAQYAQHHGIRVQTFASWIQKRRHARGDYENEQTRRKLRMGKKPRKSPCKQLAQSADDNAPASTSLSLVEVSLEASPANQPLEMVLPCGVSLRIRSVDQLALVKTIVRELSC